MTVTHAKCMAIVTELQLFINCYAIVPVFLEIDYVLVRIAIPQLNIWPFEKQKDITYFVASSIFFLWTCSFGSEC